MQVKTFVQTNVHHLFTFAFRFSVSASIVSLLKLAYQLHFHFRLKFEHVISNNMIKVIVKVTKFHCS